jgi:hypothetical protein
MYKYTSELRADELGIGAKFLIYWIFLLFKKLFYYLKKLFYYLKKHFKNFKNFFLACYAYKSRIIKLFS